MNKTMASFLAIIAACLVGIAPAKAGPHVPSGMPRVSARPAASQPLRAAIPMVFKQYKVAGARSTWEEQRSSTIVVQNVDAVATQVIVCLYPGVRANLPLPLQNQEFCFVSPNEVPPGASYPFQLDALSTLSPQFSGSARVYALGLVTAAATHQFADPGQFVTISAASAIRPVEATDRAYLPTYYSDRGGELGTHATSALFAQNLDEVPSQITIQFFAAGSSAAALTKSVLLNPGRAAVLDAPDQFTSFSGSVIVTGKKLDAAGNAAGPGRVGAHVFELADGNDPAATYNLAKAYTGFPGGSTSIHMATALCKAFGSPASASQSTAYAIQNVSDQDAGVEVTFEPGGVKTWLAISAHAKVSLKTCDVQGIAPSFSGSARMDSTAEIVAIGKALADDQPAGTGTTTAFESVEVGGSEVGVPFVTWSNDVDYFLRGGARANIAVQNIGDATAVNVVARYFTSDGRSADVLLHDIAPGAKVNTNPDDLRKIPDGSGQPIEQAIVDEQLGSVRIIGSEGSHLSALARLQRRPSAVSRVTVAEDYVAATKRELATCECNLAIPPNLPAFSYTRGRDGKQVTGSCSLRPTIITRVMRVGTCDECAKACSERLSTVYNSSMAFGTVPPPGEPPGEKDPLFGRYLMQDIAELFRKDPCHSRTPDTAFQYTFSCSLP